MPAELPILYSFRRCPYAMRARMALLISGTAWELREVKLGDKPAALIAASAKATVPVLVLPGGRVIDESLDVMRWALARHDPEDWLASADDGAVAENDGAFKHHLDRYKYPDRHDSDPAEHREAALAMLLRQEDRLRGHINLCRDTRSFADIAVMPFVRQFAAVDRVWFEAQSLPRVQAWLARHVASALFEHAMRRVPTWQPGQTPILPQSSLAAGAVAA